MPAIFIVDEVVPWVAGTKVVGEKPIVKLKAGGSALSLDPNRHQTAKKFLSIN